MGSQRGNKRWADQRRDKARRKADWERKQDDFPSITILGLCRKTGKRQMSEVDARKLAKDMMKRDNYMVNAYECFCKYWHVGHPKENGLKIRRNP